jgi:hypothetical protein
MAFERGHIIHDQVVALLHSNGCPKVAMMQADILAGKLHTAAAVLLPNTEEHCAMNSKAVTVLQHLSMMLHPS